MTNDESHKKNFRAHSKAKREAELASKNVKKDKLPPKTPAGPPEVKKRDREIAKQAGSYRAVNLRNVPLSDDRGSSPKRSKSVRPSASSHSLVQMASSDSVKVACSLCHDFAFTEEDLKTTSIGTVKSGAQAMAHVTQGLLWISSQASQARDDQTKIEKLAQEADMANDRASEMQKERDAAKLEVRSVRSRFEKKIQELGSVVEDLKGKLADAEERVLDAESHWYYEGIKDTCKAARDVGYDYTLLLAPDFIDPLVDEPALAG